MKIAEFIMAIAMWCGNLSDAGTGESRRYSRILNSEIAECKKQVLQCIIAADSKGGQRLDIVNCFAKADLPK